MFIEIDLDEEASRARLSEVDDFKAFAVVAHGPRERFARAAESIGRVEEGHVFVDVDALRELAGDRAQDADWLAGLNQMLEYAEAKGWTDAEGRVRAHVEWR